VRPRGVPSAARRLAPGHDAAARFQGPLTAVGGGPPTPTGGKTQCIVCVRPGSRLLVGPPMVAAACGGGRNEGGTQRLAAAARSSRGGTPDYAADQEPTGSTNNTSTGHGTSVDDHVVQRFPVAFHLTPDFKVVMTRDLLDSAEQTSETRRRSSTRSSRGCLVGRHPGERRRLHLLWKNSTDHQGQRRRLDHRLRPGSRASTGSDNGKTVTVVYKTRSPTGSRCSTGHHRRPTTWQKQPGGWNTGLDKNPRRSPRPARSGRRLHPGPEPDPGPQRQVLGPKANLDSIVFRFLPESTTQPAALQNNEVDLIYPSPSSTRSTGQGPARRDQRDQLRAVVRALRLQLQERAALPTSSRQAIATASTPRNWSTAPSSSSATRRAAGQSHLHEDPARPVQDHFGQYGKGDVAGATKLLEEAGYTKGSDGIYARAARS
jgi:peptide/nickel transport system substrate-binding protein